MKTLFILPFPIKFFLKINSSNPTPHVFQNINRDSPESPVKLLFRTSAWSDIDSQEELLEVDVSVVIRVEGPKHVIAELIGVAGWKAFAVDVHEGFGGEATVRAITHETAVPFLKKMIWFYNFFK